MAMPPFPSNKYARIAIACGIAVLALVGLGIGIVFRQRGSAPSPSPSMSQEQVAHSSSSEPAAPGGREVSGTIVALPEVSLLPAYQGEAVGRLNPDPAVVARLPRESYEASLKELADLAAKLAKEPGNTEAWMRVAALKQLYHNYAGAGDAYEHLNHFAPFLAVPFYNLANLYGYYLGEPAKALLKYQSAIEADPLSESLYVGFADFHREVRRDYPAAEQVLREGLAKIPSEPNLYLSLARLYREEGDSAKAIESYEQAMATGRLEPRQREAITAEIGRLRSGDR